MPESNILVTSKVLRIKVGNVFEPENQYTN